MRRRRNNKQRKILVFSAMALLLIMTAGYAAFNTQINITAKGNIAKKKAAKQLIANVVDTGDGLYADTAESGRYIYRGSNVNNYITFNNERWRIMSVESDGTIKIIKEEGLAGISWDEMGNRSSSTSTYCIAASDSGCNAWAATANLVGTPSTFIQYFPNGNPITDTTHIFSGTVTEDASLNTYLNGDYYNSLSTTAQSYITSHDFNVGTPGTDDDTEDIATDVTQEAMYKWNGKIGLMSATEYIRASNDTSCTSLSAAWNGVVPCSSNNWMFYMSEWTLSPADDYEGCQVWYVHNDGRLGAYSAYHEAPVRPVLYLKSDITLSGNGTWSDRYTIN